MGRPRPTEELSSTQSRLEWLMKFYEAPAWGYRRTEKVVGNKTQFHLTWAADGTGASGTGYPHEHEGNGKHQTEYVLRVATQLAAERKTWLQQHPHELGELIGSHEWGVSAWIRKFFRNLELRVTRQTMRGVALRGRFPPDSDILQMVKDFAGVDPPPNRERHFGFDAVEEQGILPFT
eukprot:g6501.t1